MIVMITSEEYKELVIKAKKYDEMISNHISTIDSNFDNDIPEERF